MAGAFSPIQHLPLNTAGVDFVVGDIHGRFDLLDALMKRIGYRSGTDRIIAVGDLIDRGPYCEQVLSILKKPGFYSVRGNHEDMIIDYCDALYRIDDRRDVIPLVAHNEHIVKNGGRWFLDAPRLIKMAYAATFDRLPYAIDIKTAHGLIGVVHAECPVNDWADLEAAFTNLHKDGFVTRAIWSRERFKHQDTRQIAGVHHVFVGHTIVPDPTTLGNTTYIDTGAFDSDRLTAIRLDTMEIVS